MTFKSFWQRPQAAALALVLAGGLGALGAATAGRVLQSNPPASVRLADPQVGPSRNSFARAVRRVMPAVVNISSSKMVRNPEVDPFFRQFFGEDYGRRIPRERREQSLGSGVIVSPEGYILTNNHVVDGANEVKVVLSDKREFSARVIGTDPKTDVAVLKIEASGLQPIVIGDSGKLEIGDYALAVGNPFGVGQTVTMGIVSATRRTNLGIEEYEDFIQTDAPINPGNSGGALVNERGELVGINTAIISHGSGGSQGIGFAIPVNLARTVMDQIIKEGKVTRSYLGILPQDVTPAVAREHGLQTAAGALVSEVTPDSPAAQAGLKKGDVITELNGKTVTDSNELRMTVSMMRPASNVLLKVFRDGTPRQLKVTLEELPTRVERASNDRRR